MPISHGLRFPLIKLAKKLKDGVGRGAGAYRVRSEFPLIKLAKKLKEKFERRDFILIGFPLIKLAKKLKEVHRGKQIRIPQRVSIN